MGMKRLYLLRHALADRGQGVDEDFDRPLAPEGREGAERIAGAMQSGGLIPAMVLCSGARRARETWSILAPHLGPDDAVLEVDTRDDLYLASMQRLAAVLRGLPADLGPVLMIAHNPGIQQLARRLASPESDPGALQSLSRDYPSGGLAVLAVAGDAWSDIKPGAGRLERFLRPEDLPA